MHIRFVEMQLGGLSRATFSKHSQLQAFIWLDFEFLATTIGNYLICSPACDFWAGVWERESWEAAALFPCFSLPTSASESAPQMLRLWSPIEGRAKMQLWVWRQLV